MATSEHLAPRQNISNPHHRWCPHGEWGTFGSNTGSVPFPAYDRYSQGVMETEAWATTIISLVLSFLKLYNGNGGIQHLIHRANAAANVTHSARYSALSKCSLNVSLYYRFFYVI